MEELILAFVTLVASIFIFSHAARAGLDAPTVVVFLASMAVVGYLAFKRGRGQRRWVYTAAIIGPLAIPILYFVAAISAFRKTTDAPTP